METDLDNLENTVSVDSHLDTIDSIDNEEPLLKPKIKKPRPPRTQKQIDATLKMREVYLTKAAERKVIKDEENIIRQKEKEELIVKKAIAIKKKQLKEKAILEEISDDDTPVEKLKEMKLKIEKKVGKVVNNTPPPLKIIFM